MRNHPFYNVEETIISDLDQFEPAPDDPPRIYLLNIGDGMELGFFVHSKPSDVLRVGFHAAKPPKGRKEHEYSPVTLSQSSGHAYVLFSDPTLTLNPINYLSWYLGTPAVNPDDWMERVVRKILFVTGAKHILIEGSSGGGFVSMRFATRFRQAVAVPKIPQTDLFRYLEGPLALTLRTAWPRWDRDRILNECPHRFRLADSYNNPDRHRGNIVHIVQNSGDTTHVAEHLTPFLAEVGSAPHAFSALKGLISISRPFVGPGHIPIPPAYWVAEAEFAIGRVRRMRTYTAVEAPFENPHTSAPSTATRDINISRHVTLGW